MNILPIPALDGGRLWITLFTRSIKRPLSARREEAINAVAVARFHINADGTATVELSKPMPNPRINQIILNALKAWRFFPALRYGMPVPSVQDIKIAVDVN
jgi:protein TonB